jgi:hypothetical protein
LVRRSDRLNRVGEEEGRLNKVGVRRSGRLNRVGEEEWQAQ